MTATTIEAPALTAQQLADQIVTALEGGSNHWLERFHSKKGKERATEGPWYSDPKVWDGDFEIEVLADEDSVTHIFTPDKVKDGLAWLMKNHPIASPRSSKRPVMPRRRTSSFRPACSARSSMAERLAQWRGLTRGQKIKTLVETKGADHDDIEHTMPPGTDGVVDQIERYTSEQGVVVTIVIWVDDKRDRSIVNAFDELDGPIEKFVEAI
ncbi:hypothetical protein QIH80_23520 [Bradyrhizobium elkanii]|nr:hypothetical protein QIH80_23520 [Bradyrhizobium elkanii]